MNTDKTPQVETVSKLPELPDVSYRTMSIRKEYGGTPLYTADQMRAYAQAALNARAGGDAEDAKRYRWLRTKIGFSGNGDGTSSMFAINLPVRVAGWPEVGQHAEFIDVAIDSEISALASQAQVVGRCPHCDDTGDVHTPDGEWHGVCSCPAGDKIGKTTPQSSAPVVGKPGRAEFVKGYLLASMAHAHSSLKIETLERHADLAADKAGYASESALTGRSDG